VASQIDKPKCSSCKSELPQRGSKNKKIPPKNILCDDCAQKFIKECPVCKQQFAPSALKGTRFSYCQKCAREYTKKYNQSSKGIKSSLPELECLWCLKVFKAKSRKSKCCSQACNGSHNMYMLHSDEIYRSSKLKFCDCGKLIGKQFFYCSLCRETAIGKLNRSAAMKRRISVVRSGDKGISWRAVGRRDNWVCHLCGNTVIPKAGTAYVPDGATVDHIIPIAKGGTHTWENVAVAHRSCNVLRGSKDLVDAES
jgi:hypothetical protein